MRSQTDHPKYSYIRLSLSKCPRRYNKLVSWVHWYAKKMYGYAAFIYPVKFALWNMETTQNYSNHWTEQWDRWPRTDRISQNRWSNTTWGYRLAKHRSEHSTQKIENDRTGARSSSRTSTRSGKPITTGGGLHGHSIYDWWSAYTGTGGRRRSR